MSLITILVPCFNEEKSLLPLYSEIKNVMDEIPSYHWEILFVNDGSRDNTISIIKNLNEKDNRIKYIDLSRNFGKEAAMMAGLDFAKGDCVIIMDADLQHPPSLIPEMIREWEKGYDDVYAIRKERGKESKFRKNLSLQYYKILQKTTNIDILPNVGDFRLLDRKCINALNEFRESSRYTKGLFSLIGFKKKGLVFNTLDRIEGKSSFTFFKLVNLAIDGITSFTISPLRMSTIFGFSISILAFIYMIFILIRTFLYGDEVRGFPTLIIIILFLGGIQLISLGIIGEYIGRIFNETKRRPNYIINEKIV